MPQLPAAKNPNVNPSYKPPTYGSNPTDQDFAARAGAAQAARKAAVQAANVKASADSGIVVTVASITPDALNEVSCQVGFTARAIAMPPGSIVGVPQNQFTVVAFVTNTMSPTSFFIPNVQGVLWVDLPTGMLPPPGGGTIYDAINAAIMAQISPDPPTGTNGDKPPTAVAKAPAVSPKPPTG